MAKYIRIYDTKTGDGLLVRLNKNGSVPKKYRSRRYSKGIIEDIKGARRRVM